MRIRISEFWEKSLNHRGSLGVGVAVWAVMLGGVLASVQINTTHVAADRSYVEHEPTVTASLRQKYVGPAKPAVAEPQIAAAIQVPERPHTVMPVLQAENIPTPTPRPAMPSTKAMPLVATASIPVPSLDRYKSCDNNCATTDVVTASAQISVDEAANLPFDESPVLEGRVDEGMPIISDLKQLATATLQPLKMLKMPFRHDEEAMLINPAPRVQ